MRPRTARRGGWLWPVVLVVSAALLLVTGHQLLGPRTSAANVPLAASVQDPGRAAPTPSATATPGGPRWRTRDAAPPPPTRVVPPVRLVASSVGLDLPVTPTGVDARGEMALPDHPTELGWYRFGPTPADRQGAVVLAGHVDSLRFGTGPLVRASQLERGDRIDVEDASGRTTSYTVVAVQLVKKTSFSPDDVFARSGKPILRLITCGGPYEPARGGYQDNLVVTAERR